jgi:hypothetical protein
MSKYLKELEEKIKTMPEGPVKDRLLKDLEDKKAKTVTKNGGQN